MAQFTRVNGDFQQVFNVDSDAYTTTGVNTSTSAVTVNTWGPKLDFFTITLATVQTNATVALQTVNAIQQLATIAIYEFTDAGTDTLAVAVFPTGAWTTATLTTAIDAATGGSSSVAATATFTN